MWCDLVWFGLVRLRRFCVDGQSFFSFSVFSKILAVERERRGGKGRGADEGARERDR